MELKQHKKQENGQWRLLIAKLITFAILLKFVFGNLFSILGALLGVLCELLGVFAPPPSPSSPPEKCMLMSSYGYLAIEKCPLSAIQCAGLCPYSSLSLNMSTLYRSVKYSTVDKFLKKETTMLNSV